MIVSIGVSLGVLEPCEAFRPRSDHAFSAVQSETVEMSSVCECMTILSDPKYLYVLFNTIGHCLGAQDVENNVLHITSPHPSRGNDDDHNTLEHFLLFSHHSSGCAVAV